MAIDFELNSSGIAVITINRPERMNAMDAEHYAGLSAAWIRVRDDDDVRVAIVTGGGDKAFTAGMDLKALASQTFTWSEMWKTQSDMLLNRGLEVWKPVIAAVNGYCLGGGVTLMLATDIRIACETASFGVAEVKRGLIAGNGGTQRLTSQLPHAIAMELLLTGDAMTARDAERWGLINKVVPTAADVLPAAMAVAERIAANAPLAVQATKELALKSRDVSLATGLRLEQLANRLLLQSDDAKEGPAAFAEKRKAVFTGA